MLWKISRNFGSSTRKKKKRLSDEYESTRDSLENQLKEPRAEKAGIQEAINGLFTLRKTWMLR